MPSLVGKGRRSAAGNASVEDAPWRDEPVLHWAPGVPTFFARRGGRNRGLRVAGVMSEGLKRGLDFEARVRLLNPDDWREAAAEFRPDLLLVETCWRPAGGHWAMAVALADRGFCGLADMVGHFRAQGVPAVLWITQDSAHHGHYKDFARLFDEVFCVDPAGCEKLGSEGVRARHLPHAIQPALYNPFRTYDRYDALDIGVLFDGWSDALRYPGLNPLLEELVDCGLLVLDSRASLPAGHAAGLGRAGSCVGGCVYESGRILALKYARTCLSVAESTASRSTRERMALEAAACRVPQVHRGAIGADDLRSGLVTACADDVEALVELARHEHDWLYRERRAQMVWRAVHDAHTLAHRLQVIAEAVGLDSGFEEYPPATLITPTYRPELIPECLERFDRQTYPCKELMLVYNGDGHAELPETWRGRDDVRLLRVPGEMFTGAAMNVGLAAARGAYSFKMDDDDTYGDNYVLDMILHARALDASLFGKPLSRFVHFESDDTLYRNRKKKDPLCVVPWRHRDHPTPEWFAGCSISGRTDKMRERGFVPNAFRCSDTTFFLEAEVADNEVVFIADGLNMVVERRADISSHTWQMDEARLKSNSDFFGFGTEGVCI